MSADAVSYNRRIVEEFRANEGRVGGDFEGAPLVLMTALGAKSGQPRTTPTGTRTRATAQSRSTPPTTVTPTRPIGWPTSPRIPP